MYRGQTLHMDAIYIWFLSRIIKPFLKSKCGRIWNLFTLWKYYAASCWENITRRAWEFFGRISHRFLIRIFQDWRNLIRDGVFRHAISSLQRNQSKWILTSIMLVNIWLLWRNALLDRRGRSKVFKHSVNISYIFFFPNLMASER